MGSKKPLPTRFWIPVTETLAGLLGNDRQDLQIDAVEPCLLATG